MDTSLSTLKLIRKRAELLTNPLSGILIPLGIIILVSAWIPISYSTSVVTLIIWQISLFFLGFLLLFGTQKWYSHRFGSVVPDEDNISYLVRNSAFLFVVFASSVVYGSTILYYDFGKWIGILLGGLGALGTITFTSMWASTFIEKALKKEQPRFINIVHNSSYIVLYFLSVWSLSEVLQAWLSVNGFPINITFLGVALFLLVIWLSKPREKWFLLIIATYILVIGIFFGLMDSPWYPHSSIINEFYFSIQQHLSLLYSYNFPWIFIGIGVLLWGFVEYIKTVKLIKNIHVSE